MAGGSDAAEAASLSCVQCGKPAHLQYVVLFSFCYFMVNFQTEPILSFKVLLSLLLLGYEIYIYIYNIFEVFVSSPFLYLLFWFCWSLYHMGYS